MTNNWIVFSTERIPVEAYAIYDWAAKRKRLGRPFSERALQQAIMPAASK